jgi:MFS family permease
LTEDDEGSLPKKSRDMLRQGTNLIFSVAQLLVTFLPALGIGIGIGDGAMGSVPPVEPIYWAFFIWFLIYAACIVYGIYQALPTERESEVLRRIGFPTASAFLGVTVYALVAQFGGSDWILIAIFVWILAALLSAFFRLTEYQPSLTRTERYTVRVPISLLTGWVSLAILVNLASALKTSGIVQSGTVETAFSVTMLLIACVVASFIIFRGRGNGWYALPVIWGLIGVVVANFLRQPNLVVAVAAGVVALVTLGVLLMVRRRENEETLRMKGAIRGHVQISGR